MFDIYEHYFMYGDFDSSVYELIFSSVNTEQRVNLESEQKVNAVYSRRNNTHHLTRLTFTDEPLSFDAEITTECGTPISSEDIKTIEQALFLRSDYTKLYSLDNYNSNDPGIYLNCLFTNPERIEGNGGIVGYKFTIVTDSKMAWEDEQTQSFDLTNPSQDNPNGFTVVVDSDIVDYVYPSVKFTLPTNGGSFTLYNNSDESSRLTTFDDIPLAEFIMDSRINYISEGGYSYFTDRNFIRLKNGTNNFTFDGDLVAIDFTFNNRKFL